MFFIFAITLYVVWWYCILSSTFLFVLYFQLHLDDIMFKGTDEAGPGIRLPKAKISGDQVKMIINLFVCLFFYLLQMIWGHSLLYAIGHSLVVFLLLF